MHLSSSNSHFFHSFLFFLGLQSLFKPIKAYYLDNDWSPERKRFLAEAFDNAFELIKAGQGAQDDGNEAQNQLFRYLYKDPDPTISQVVKTSLDGMLTMSAPVASLEALGQEDVRVYCTHDKRIVMKIVKGRIKAFDKYLKEILRLRERFNRNFALAYTVVPRDRDKPSYIQVCPWFLNYGMTRYPQFQVSIGQKILGKLAAAVAPLVTKLLYTPIDLFQLFDKVMVHEMAHTKSGLRLRDVGGSGGYEWKNCRRLSTVRTRMGAGIFGPERNADTIGLWCSGAHMIGAGITIKEDGTFTQPAAKRRLTIDPYAQRARPIF